MFSDPKTVLPPCPDSPDLPTACARPLSEPWRALPGLILKFPGTPGAPGGPYHLKEEEQSHWTGVSRREPPGAVAIATGWCPAWRQLRTPGAPLRTRQHTAHSWPVGFSGGPGTIQGVQEQSSPATMLGPLGVHTPQSQGAALHAVPQNQRRMSCSGSRSSV